MGDLLHALMPFADRFNDEFVTSMETAEVDIPVDDLGQFEDISRRNLCK